VLGVSGEVAPMSSDGRRAVLKMVAGACDLPPAVGATSLGTAPVVEEVQCRDTVSDRVMSAMVQVKSS
jgi:4-hydroxy-tetrahydrodipicolinate synthase